MQIRVLSYAPCMWDGVLGCPAWDLQHSSDTNSFAAARNRKLICFLALESRLATEHFLFAVCQSNLHNIHGCLLICTSCT